MKSGRNRRDYPEHVCESRHLKLKDLKVEAQHLDSIYLSNNYIPAGPPVEFHVSHLKHDTNRDGLHGIWRDSGFRNPFDSSLVWWNLSVGPEEISSAERRLLEKIYPDRTEEQVQMQKSFLDKFTTSHAFEKTSRLGSYRFTFPVEEVLKAYSQQFCSGAPPVMRVFKTVLFQQKVMYVVLVHSPINNELLSDRPLLTDDPLSVCSYKDGCFIWRPEAMCGTHNYRLLPRPQKKQMEVEQVALPLKYYVWDQVAITLHVDKQVLNFDSNRLRENLTYCSRAVPSIVKYHEFDEYPQAAEVVKILWPHCHSQLKRAEQLDRELWTNMDTT